MKRYLTPLKETIIVKHYNMTSTYLLFTVYLTLHLICQFEALQIQQQIKILDVKNMKKWGYNYMIE